MASVEVFMPCYNASKYIVEALESISKQTYGDYKVLIVDDGSTDDSVAIVEAYIKNDSRFQLIHNDRNHGECYTRNRALLECEAEYIAFLDADDRMPSYRLEMQMKYLRDHPECDVVSGGYQLMSEEGALGKKVLFDELSNEQIVAAMLFRNVIAIGSSVFKKSFVIENNIKFDESFLSLGDYNFWVDCIGAGAKIHVLDEVLQEYRVVATGLSRVHSAPDKIVQRNRNFDFIHQKMLDFHQIEFNDKEKQLFFEYTNEESKSFGKKIKDSISFMQTQSRIKQQNRNRELIAECNRWRKQYYRL